jgi:hypothetical protein
MLRVKQDEMLTSAQVDPIRNGIIDNLLAICDKD